MQKAFITGITGQDGSCLAELLLKKGYDVHGVIRRASTFNTSRIDHLDHDPHINGGAQLPHEAIRRAGLVKKVRYYQASSSEMFGQVQMAAGPARSSSVFA